LLQQHFNSGDRNAEAANCWYTPGCSFVNTASELIEGSHTLRTGQLSGGPAYPNGLISPWIKLEGNGTISFKHRLQTWNNGIVRRLYVSLEAADTPNMQDTLFVFNYNSSHANTTTSTAVNIPAYTAGKVYRIRIMALGTGGNARCLIDAVSIKGKYWSCPARNCSPQPAFADRDGDGVADNLDEFPDDSEMAFANHYPATGYGTLLYEDLWPANGDNDFNDLVLNYRITTVTNAQNKVVECRYLIITKAIGGYYRNGFAFQLDGIASGRVINVSRSKPAGNLYSLAANGTEARQTVANIPVHSNTQALLANVGGGVGVNINPHAPFVVPDTTHIHVRFLQNGLPAAGYTAMSPADIGIHHFNPYIIANQQRGVEIHAADRSPSNLANAAFFSQYDDRSNPATGFLYKNKNNLPWVLNIAQNIPYTQEGIDITAGYSKLAAWAASGGSLFADWYMEKAGYRNVEKLY
jgi:LruC domain-containing protein